MLYLYDEAVVADLKRSFNSENMGESSVRVIDPEEAISVLAQLQDDNIKLPAVIVTRDLDTPIDQDRWNFTRLHQGVVSVFDSKHNDIYYERSIPVKVGYRITVLTTNTADMDELIRELLFKYSTMYFLTIRLPYEADRKMRFGIVVDFDQDIERKSGRLEYGQSGQLYQTIIPLRCEGCSLLSYTPRRLQRVELESPTPVDQDTVL